MPTIDWNKLLPHCSKHTSGFCECVINSIGNRADPRLRVHGNYVVPVASRRYFDDQKQLPRLQISLAGKPNTQFVAIQLSAPRWMDHLVIGYGVDGQLHRRDVIEMMLPYLAAWDEQHPCHCQTQFTLASMIDNNDINTREFALKKVASRAAYRLAMKNGDEYCWVCDDSDLIPDPGGNPSWNSNKWTGKKVTT